MACKLKYDDAREQIRDGDILLCSGQSYIAKTIQYITNSPYNHVGVFSRMGARVMLFEAWDYGVRLIPFSLYFTKYYDNGKQFEGDLFVARKDAGISNFDFALSKLGISYDYIDLFKILRNETIFGRIFGRSKYKKTEPLICSEYVYDIFVDAGSLQREDIFIYPSHFVNMGFNIQFQIIKEKKNEKS